MRLRFSSLAITAILAAFVPAGIAQAKDPVQDALRGCAKELKTHPDYPVISAGVLTSAIDR